MEYGREEEAVNGFRNGKARREGARRQADAGRTFRRNAQIDQTTLAAGEGEEESRSGSDGEGRDR